MPDMNMTIGIRGAVMQRKVGPIATGLFHLFIKPNALPPFENFRFPFGQVATHGKFGFWQIKGLFVVHCIPPEGLLGGKKTSLIK